MGRPILSRWKSRLFAAWALVLVWMPASIDRAFGSEIVLPSTGETRTSATSLDRATFVLELLAFVAKEVLPDSPPEFSESLIGSRLSGSMPEQRSDFGKHCLMIVAHFRGAMLSPPASSIEPGFPGLRRIWSAFESGTEGAARDVSLNVEIGIDKAGVRLTFPW